MRQKMKLLWELFFTFMKVGLFTFGGGYAMISVIETACVERKKWITHEEMMHMTVIAESTPGPIAINCATYVGLQKAGLLGSIIATVGMVVPSFVIIFTIAQFLDNFLEFTIIAHAFQGIRIGVGILILRVGLNMMKKAKKTPLSKAIMGSAFAAVLLINVLKLNISTITLMILAGIVSVSIFTFREGGAGK